MSKAKIRLRDGTFCYSGANCRLHGANSVVCAKRALVEAEVAFSSASLSDPQFEVLAKNLYHAKQRWDATVDGQHDLRRKIEQTSGMEQDVLRMRLMQSQATAERLESENKLLWENAQRNNEGELVLSKNHTYRVPVFEREGEGMYSPTVGSKHADEYIPLAKISSNVRKDMKEAVSKNYLPSNLTYRVTKRPKGNSIRVEVRGLTDENIYGDTVGDRIPRLSEPAKELQARVQGIADAYNSQVLRPEIDYVQARYFAVVILENESSSRQRRADARNVR